MLLILMYQRLAHHLLVPGSDLGNMLEHGNLFSEHTLVAWLSAFLVASDELTGTVLVDARLIEVLVVRVLHHTAISGLVKAHRFSTCMGRIILRFHPHLCLVCIGDRDACVEHLLLVR